VFLFLTERIVMNKVAHPEYLHVSGDTALTIIDDYRQEVDDRTSINLLSDEFPYYAEKLGLTGVKLMDLTDNKAGAFKWRGAMVSTHAHANEGVAHLVAPSAGNAARGGVFAALAHGTRLTVAVPRNAPQPKREGIRMLTDSNLVEVKVVGNNFDETYAWAKESPYTMLAPYDCPAVMRGQGTVLDDLLRLNPGTTDVVTPVGGGGLAAGMVLRSQELGREDIMFHLAEAPGNHSASRSLRLGRLAATTSPNQRFGGSAVRRIGELPYEVLSQAVNVRTLSVSEEDVDQLSELYLDGRRELLRDDTPNFEPTTLVAVAAMKQLFGETSETVVLGTGRNDTVFPAYVTQPYKTNIFGGW
jgi:threonine dehydratase